MHIRSMLFAIIVDLIFPYGRRHTLCSCFNLLSFSMERRLFVAANERYLHQPEQQLVQWSIDQLVRAGAAVVEGDALVNCD